MSAYPTAEAALQFMADAVLYQRIDLTGTWQGWKLRGRELVSPDGDRISAERLRGLLFVESLRTPKRRKPGRPSKAELAARPVAQVEALPRETVPNVVPLVARRTRVA